MLSRRKKHQLFIYLTFTLRRPSYPRRIKTECSKSPWCVNLRFLLEHSSSFSFLFLESSFYRLGIILNPDNPQNMQANLKHLDNTDIMSTNYLTEKINLRRN